MGDALLVVAGALVGACASILGSVWIARRELVRSNRIRLFDELLPAIKAQNASPHPEVSATEPVVRAASLAGRRDRELALRVQQAAKSLASAAAFVGFSYDESYGDWYVGGGRTADLDGYQKCRREAEEARARFESYLLRKVRHPVCRLAIWLGRP